MHDDFSRFLFSPRPPESADVVVDASVATSEELLQVLARDLRFPGYFGQNWDALVDCLSDFHWRTEGIVTVDHAGLPALVAPELGIYLGCLAGAVGRYRRGERRALHVHFRERDREAIRTALAGDPGVGTLPHAPGDAHLTFALTSPDLEAARVVVEEALGVRMAPHEGLFRGGDYYRLGSFECEVLVLQSNREPIDDEPFDTDAPVSAFLLHVERTARAERVIAALMSCATLLRRS